MPSRSWRGTSGKSATTTRRSKSWARIRAPTVALLEQDPENALLLNDVVVLGNQEAEVLIEQGELGLALERLHEVRALLDALAADVELVDEEHSVAWTHQLLARAFARTDRLDQAVSSYRLAIEAVERGLVPQPRSAILKSMLAEQHYERSALYDGRGDCGAGRQDREKADALASELEHSGSEIPIDHGARVVLPCR